MSDIVIIGGGPVGNWTAIQLKQRNPGLDVRIYERHPDYRRDHILNISESSFTRHAANDHASEKLRETIIRAHCGMDIAQKTFSIRIQDLEKILKSEADRLGVSTTYRKIETPREVMDMHPECKLFVAADGTRSIMRANLLGRDSIDETPMFKSIDVTYASRGNPAFTKAPTYDRVDDMVVEGITRAPDGTASVNLRFLVQDSLYNALHDASFSNPMTFAKMEEKFRDWRPGLIDLKRVDLRVREFMKLRAAEAGDDFIEGSERIVPVKLSRYASKKFAAMADASDRKAGWFLVGDAAMGMPFSRSINSGLMQGAQLAGILANSNTGFGQKIRQYESTRGHKLSSEFNNVAFKEGAVKLYQNVLRPVLRTGGKVAFVVIGIPVFVVLFGISALTGGRLGLRMM